MPLQLPNITIFAGLNDRALAVLLERAVELNFPKGAVIVRERESGNNLFVLAQGAVRICKNFGQPGEIELATLGPGEFFGEMCLLETLPRCATVQAATAVTAFSISSFDFHHLYKTLPDQYGILILNIARDISRRLRRLDEVFAARH